MIVYQYFRNGPDQYLVIKRWLVEGKQKLKYYQVSFKGGDTLCDCPGFSRWNKKCKHVKNIMAQLQDKGGIIQDLDDAKDFKWEYLGYKNE